jgi:hypothetical protein
MGRSAHDHRFGALKALRPREAAVFAGLADAYCRPQPELPPVPETDAVAFIDALAASSRPLNRIAFKLILRGVDLTPRLSGQRARFTALGAERRAQFVQSLERSRWTLVQTLSRLLKTLTVMAYYGDPRVLGQIGYDADANLARARDLRTREGRP